jgi:uncharacterized protein (DUF2236 family)
LRQRSINTQTSGQIHLGDFTTTFRVVFTMIFGTLEQALASSRYFYQLHTRVQGEISESVAAYGRGSHYEANEVEALRWVYATLVESALLAYESVLPPLSLAEQEAYYDESKTLATLFGIPVSALPADWSAFEAYNRAMWASDSLGVNTLSREMAHRILHGRGSWVPVPHWYRALTAAWMPDGLREAFALPYSEREERAAACALRWLPLFYRRIPVLSGMSGHIRRRVRVFRPAALAFSLARAIASGWGSRECYSPNPNTKDLASGIRSLVLRRIPG